MTDLSPLSSAPILPVPDGPLLVCNRDETARLLDFAALVDALSRAAVELQAGTILSPARLVVPFGQGGVLLSMPATAPDIAIQKLVNVQRANAKAGLPTINGTVTVCDGSTGRLRCVLDGPEVTGRRTAAITLLAIRALFGREGRGPAQVLLIGTGAQARHHVQALAALHPRCRILVRGRDAASSDAFCRRIDSAQVSPCGPRLPETVDVVVTLTTSTTPVYDEPARPERLLIGVGAFKPEMAELGKTPLDGSDLYADDPAGARHEAGDLLRAGVDWARVKSLATALQQPHDRSRPAAFKSVGTAAWDLAAARVALQVLTARGQPTRSAP